MTCASCTHHKPLSLELTELLRPDYVPLLRRGGKRGAYVVGAAVAGAVLFAVAPHLAHAAPDAIASVVSFAEAVNRAMPSVSPVTILMGAKALTDAVAADLYASVIAPAADAIGSMSPGISAWVAAQRDAALSIGTTVFDVSKSVISHLSPQSAGDAVEKGIVALAALKSFSEGLEIAVNLFRKAGRALSRKPSNPVIAKAAAPAEPSAPAPAPAPVVIEHHHHYYHGAAPPKAEPAPEVHEWSDPSL